MKTLSPLEQKTKLIIKDLETAFNIVEWRQSNVATIRGWTLTIFLAYVGFMITLKLDNFLIIPPFVAMLIYFARQEGRETLLAYFDGAEIVKIQKIFMELDPEKFTDLIRKYEFRDYRLSKMKLKFVYSKTELLQYTLSRRVVYWYGLQLAFVLIIYVANVLDLY